MGLGFEGYWSRVRAKVRVTKLGGYVFRVQSSLGYVVRVRIEVRCSTVIPHCRYIPIKRGVQQRLRWCFTVVLPRKE